MGRFALLFGTLLLGLALVQSGTGQFLGIDDTQIMWAALLPGIYIVGMLLLLRD